MAASPKPKPKPKKPKVLKGEAAIAEYQRQVSPEGVRRAEEIARKLLEQKYPEMYVPKKRTNTMIPGR
jgi:hypothetical protein